MNIKKIVYTLIFLMLISKVSAQTIWKQKDYEMQHTVFITVNSNYNLTRKSSFDSKYLFYRDFKTLDTLIYYSLNDTVQYKFNLLETIDTIYSLYDNQSIYSLPKEVEYGGIEFIEDELCEDVAHAYVFRLFNINKLDTNNIYSLLPLVSSNKRVEKYGYELFIVNNWNNGNLKVQYKKIEYTKNTLKVPEIDSCTIIPSRKSISKFRKKIDKIKEYNSSICIRPGNRSECSLLYFNNKKHLINFDCLMNKSKKEILGGNIFPNPFIVKDFFSRYF